MVKRLSRKLVGLALLGLLPVACQSMPLPEGENATADKITFDLDEFDQDGLYGPPGGKRSLDYEFCIPEGNQYAQEVRVIDPTINLFPDSAGRIGCTEDQTLAIGNTHQDEFRIVLMELANLEYVERIQRVDWE
jgi:hypothetical protein